jgi:hypothetical protein
MSSELVLYLMLLTMCRLAHYETDLPAELATISSTVRTAK